MMPNYHAIPAATIETIQAHVLIGRPTGHFVEAVLSNDLKEACGRADDNNAAALWQIVCYCYNEIPTGAWGSPEKVRAWRAQGGLEGLKKAVS